MNNRFLTKIKVFAGLKFLEILTLGALSIGALFYGRFLFSLMDQSQSHPGFVEWVVGVAALAVSIGLISFIIAVLYVIIKKWLTANWEWADRIVKKMERKR